jgi:CelD/BcsL family acetyltransferase involved in cellulose biosynthesis
MNIRRIDKARDFMALGPLWSKLARASGQVSPFLSYDWFWCCWHGVWPRHQPEILVVEDAGTPLAVIPLMRWKGRLRGLPIRYLGFLAYPNTPMADLLTIADHGLVVEAFLSYLATRSDWDVVWLQKLPASSQTVKEFEGTLPGRLAWRRASDFLMPYLAIEGDWKNFYDTKRQLGMRTFQELQGRFAGPGDLNIEEHRIVDPWSHCLQEMIGVISRSSRENGAVTYSAFPRMPEFFRELTRRATKNGWLSLWLLRFKGRAIAMEYQLCADGKAQALWAYGDPTYHEILPAHVLHLSLLQALFERGCVYEYCMAPGSYGEERLWATGSHETLQLKLYRPGFYSRLLSRLETDNVSGGPK